MSFALGLLGCGGPVHESSAAPVAELTLAFAGDVQFSSGHAASLDDSALLDDPSRVIVDALSDSDVTLLNLDTAITSKGTPRAITALRVAGVDAVSLANDHSMDYGRVGLADTLAAAKAGGLPVFGAGEDATAAYRPWRTTLRGTRIAVLGLNQVEELVDDWAARDNRSGTAQALDQKRALAAVSAARTSSDLVIVMPHWGFEQDDCPNVAQRDFAAELSDAGADVIVGSHAQVLQGRGYLGRTYVAFGMGVFVSSQPSVHTGVLKLTLRGRDVVADELLPAMVSPTGAPIPVSAEVAKQERERLDGLRPCTYLNQSASPVLSAR